MHPTKKIFSIVLTSAILIIPISVLAAWSGDTGLGASASQAGLDTTPGQLPIIIGTVIKAALGLVGVIFLVLMVYAGYIWMIARGDESKTSKAKDTITAAIIGIIIVVGAYALTNFVVTAMTSAGGGGTGAATTGTKINIGDLCSVGAESQCPGTCRMDASSSYRCQ